MKMNALTVSIQLPSRLLQRILLALVFMNLFALTGTGLAQLYSHKKVFFVSFALEQSNLAQENVAATWYSSMLLLLVALVSAVCFVADKQYFKNWKDQMTSYGWLVFCAIFTLLSFDEIGSLHESIGDTAVFKSLGNSDGAGWFAFYVLVVLTALFMMAFVWVRMRRNKRASFFAFLGVLFFLSNPLQEVYEINSFHAAANQATWQRPLSMLLLEEGSEIFGSLCLLISVTIYAVSISRLKKSTTANGGIDVSFSINSRTIFYTTGLLTIGMGIFILILQHFEGMMPGDNGIPGNWFPSAIAFIVALISFYLYSKSHHSPTDAPQWLYLPLSLLAIFLSVYFGSNLYAYLMHKNNNWIKFIPNILLLIAAIAISIQMVHQFKNRWSRAGITGWIVLFGATLMMQQQYIPALGWLSFSCLLLSLLFQVTHKITKTQL